LIGNVTSGVVRIGDTIRRPVGPWSDAVDALLAYLQDVGFTAAPRPLGRDDRGRQVLEYVPGELGHPGGTYTLAELTSIGRLLADLHAALAGFAPPVGASWNLAYAAQSMAGLHAGRPPESAAERLRAFINGYRADRALCEELPTMLGRRARAMVDLLRDGAVRQRQPWARIWTEDGPYWTSTADYLDTHAGLWRAALR
jgi:Phosphotransferase enzyme family